MNQPGFRVIAGCGLGLGHMISCGTPWKAATKKPAWENSTSRDHIVPGLFSDLFNVAASRPAQITTERCHA
jgi:hypothetical protein